MRVYLQVVPVSRWPLALSAAAHATTDRPTSPVRVVSLSRWPFTDTAASASLPSRLTMDGMMIDRASSTAARNEYVDGPTPVSAHGNPAGGVGRRRRVGRKAAAAPAQGVAAPGPAAVDVVPQVDVADSPRRRRRGGGLAVKMRRLLTCVGSTSSASSSSGTSSSADELPPGVRGCRAAGDRGGGGGTVCRRCGRCRCGECAAAEQPSSLRRARSLVDLVSCMCCVRSLFYHCLRDDDGDDLDCSDEPCACTDRPHCAARWTVMAALLPCLPCLCLYLPLRCTVDAACRRRRHSTHRSTHSCRCCAPRHSRHPGLKGLLESESSST